MIVDATRQTLFEDFGRSLLEVMTLSEEVL